MCVRLCVTQIQTQVLITLNIARHRDIFCYTLQVIPKKNMSRVEDLMQIMTQSNLLIAINGHRSDYYVRIKVLKKI